MASVAIWIICNIVTACGVGGGGGRERGTPKKSVKKEKMWQKIYLDNFNIEWSS